MKSDTLDTVHHVHDAEEPCDPERLKVLEDAMREAIHAYLTYSDPDNRISREEVLGRLTDILDRTEVADAANFDMSTVADPSDDQEQAPADDTGKIRRVV
jgi:hypothetical protein